MKLDDAEVVVVLGSILHDLGMIVQRRDHEKYSAFIAFDVLQNLLNANLQGRRNRNNHL